jgi:hypothetical protein
MVEYNGLLHFGEFDSEAASQRGNFNFEPKSPPPSPFPSRNIIRQSPKKDGQSPAEVIRIADLLLDGKPPSEPEPSESQTAAAPTEPNEPQASAANSMPADLENTLRELEEWAQANRRDASRDLKAFWALKIPAIVASASAGVWAHLELPTVSVLFGAVASVCVIVDGIQPRGMLRNTHLRAFHDLRILATKMVAEWRGRASNAHADNMARRIIRNAEAERERIAHYIRDAETALNPNAITRP